MGEDSIGPQRPMFESGRLLVILYEPPDPFPYAGLVLQAVLSLGQEHSQEVDPPGLRLARCPELFHH